ncbi:MAG: hypothetical protein EON59_03245 [Alphaproteobacteria bacterium]|nr:MAG: hypothetical protein EON59_03245 [Alphaproteobacteria bacterium]
MTDPAIIHVIGLAAVWVIFLSSIRFAVAGFYGLRPVATCIWHLLRCDSGDRIECRRRLLSSLDKQYTELLIAITTPWSVMLLFMGMVMLGCGLSFASIGDIAQLVARAPDKWAAFDRGMDLTGAMLMCTGMASIHAAITKRRSLSLVLSFVFTLIGVGIGVVTVVRP